MEGEAKSDTTSSTFVVDVVNSAHFRVIFADEINIGLSPSGMINIDFANEREPPPRRITYTFSAANDVLDFRRQGDADLVREVEVSIMMPRKAATELRDMLTSLLDDADADSEIDSDLPDNLTEHADK